MTVRAGMAQLITELRRMGACGTADFAVAGVTYWTDAQLQTALDKRRERVHREAIAARDWFESSETFVYQLRKMPLEGTASGTAWFAITDLYDNVVTNYTLDQLNGQITFNNDTDGDTFWVKYHVYDLERTAADVWTEKATLNVGGFDWESDNMKVTRSRSQINELAMANYWMGKAKPKVVKMRRTDVNPSE